MSEITIDQELKSPLSDGNVIGKDWQEIVSWLSNHDIDIDVITKQLNTSVKQEGFHATNRPMLIRLYLWTWKRLEENPFDNPTAQRVLRKISKLIRRTARNQASQEEEEEYQKVQGINDKKKTIEVISELKVKLKLGEEIQSNIASIKKKSFQSEEDVEYVKVLNMQLEDVKKTIHALESKWDRLGLRLSLRDSIICGLGLEETVM